ncbi:PrsW family glutamic-type intramembrane protease [Streptomyces sp. ATE26]|uniref:PrsW family glutamic-type intramembrane protease n=1 Tax=Streptomyces sp. ATE26 TaxID=2954237 RepID=UPI002482C804|nr:PrsW family glutamic-type intramembrane protease [Streptomyces sp. ATE26]MDI1455789.1 PrsW family glutamic-type intramembrane protease [Streptomyces sp. ATE26]
MWRRCLRGGLALWALTAVTAYTTRGTVPLPALVLLGGFLLPVAFVLWAYERHGRDLGVSAVLGCFLAGGVLGVPGALLTQSHLLHPSLGRSTGAALAEEAAKLGALVFALRRQPGVRGPRAGLVLGAAVGLGFAAVESCAYAFDALLLSDAADLRVVLETEFPRALLTPAGHGLWTAIAGAALLSHRRPNGRFRLAAPVVGTWLGVCVLHAAWDATRGVAGRLVARVYGTEAVPGPFGQPYLPRSGAGQEHLFALLSTGGLVLVAALGVAWVRSLAPGDAWRNTP